MFSLTCWWPWSSFSSGLRYSLAGCAWRLGQQQGEPTACCGSLRKGTPVQRSRRPYSAGSEGGSTLLEVIVGLLVLSLIGLGAWSAASVSLRTVGRTGDAIRLRTRVLQVDDRLRGLSARVRTPYWMPEHLVALEGGRLSVGCLDGDLGKSLVVEFSGGILSISDGDGMSRFSGFTGAELAPARDESQRVIGIRLQLKTAAEQPVTIVTRFGGVPLWSGASP
jgi:hypothetical protein